MGRIVATIDIESLNESGSKMKLYALVDTGVIYLTLPSAWKKRFGKFGSEEIIELQTATQKIVKGTVCGPVRIKIEGFRAIYNEVLDKIVYTTLINGILNSSTRNRDAKHFIHSLMASATVIYRLHPIYLKFILGLLRDWLKSKLIET